MSGPPITPELALRDPAAGAAMLVQVFGFRPQPDGTLQLGNQRISVVAGQPDGHGTLHHLALAVDDVATALAAALSRGGRVERAETPDGPVLIPEFWDAGAQYVFVEGPEGARIELCAHPGATRPGLPGHDHIGIACRDLPAMRAFFLGLGLTEIAATVLRRRTGDVTVSFLSNGATVLELYAPPVPPTPAAAPFWRRLIMPGLPQGGLQGPEGIMLVPLKP